MPEQQPEFRAVYFQVTDGAQAEMMGGASLLYVGMSYRIPKQHIEDAQRVYNDTHDADQAQQMIAGDDVDPDHLLQTVRDRGYLPASDAILERFDTVDGDTGDILVLLRVPCVMTLAQGGGLSEAA